ncbi:hypothetical protein OU995_19120 [Roseateles sp. SL47]|uniref:hypothetical protein n=1 Tax=Roseateles sp. SL47 TaxID=2995138 RepID=UPI00226D643E|nr:hypothetical protein [Roseateles sp. SL47]WAC71681.1 hypothetical protein OU995_19120 [Roseateles sp. SL47]
MRRLNVRTDLLTSVESLIAQQNEATASLPGEPRVDIVRDHGGVRAAAVVMTQAFVENHDKGWLAWLKPEEVRRIEEGDHALGERRLTPILAYLLRAGLGAGGILCVETVQAADGIGPRVVRGACLRRLPMAWPARDSLLYKYLVGGWHALRTYGLPRALAADRAQTRLRQATELARRAQGIPQGCIYSSMMCVPRRFEGLHVARRLSGPFLRLADEQGLHMLLQSSNPDRNDERVFKRFGFSRIGEFNYGVSRLNAVGPYTITLLARPPRQIEVHPS